VSYVSEAVTGLQDVTLTLHALRVIERETLASQSDGNETGGILLGYRVGPNVTQVCFAGTPGPKAVRRPDFFLRDLAHTQAFANRHFLEDAAVWIGEWHTHPHSSPTPSPQDLSTYMRLLDDPELDFEGEFISLIVGPAEPSSRLWFLASWVCSANQVRHVPIQLAP
jgi:integrative and conjugative element protein (TIGR02256 family)